MGRRRTGRRRHHRQVEEAAAWVAVAELKYDGSNNNGMPDNETYELLNDIENEIMSELKDFDGYLNIGRQTARGAREIYFACRDFRKPVGFPIIRPVIS